MVKIGENDGIMFIYIAFLKYTYIMERAIAISKNLFSDICIYYYVLSIYNHSYYISSTLVYFIFIYLYIIHMKSKNRIFFYKCIHVLSSIHEFV